MTRGQAIYWYEKAQKVPGFAFVARGHDHTNGDYWVEIKHNSGAWTRCMTPAAVVCLIAQTIEGAGNAD